MKVDTLANDDRFNAESIILFDGVCNLCQGSVHFIIRRDPQAHFKFASLQSDTARRLLRNWDNNQAIESLIFIEKGRIYTGSTAALRICRKLHRGWKLLHIFIFLPRPLRDLLYRWIARNRYRWFGKTEQCMLPTPEIRSRFLD